MTRLTNVFPEISHDIIGCAMRVHSKLGPGLLESIYEECLAVELSAAKLPHERQVPVPILYSNRRLASALRLDLVVAEKVVVEVKAVEQLLPIHESQLLTYLKMTGLPLGLLINFNVTHLRLGIRRRVWTPPDRLGPVSLSPDAG